MGTGWRASMASCFDKLSMTSGNVTLSLSKGDSRALQPQQFRCCCESVADMLESVRITPTRHIETYEASQ